MRAPQRRCDVVAAAEHCGCAELDPSVAPVVVAAWVQQQASYEPDAVVDWGQRSKLEEDFPGADLVRICRRPFDMRTLPTE